MRVFEEVFFSKKARFFLLVLDAFGHGHGGIVVAGRAGNEAPVARHDGARIARRRFEGRAG